LIAPASQWNVIDGTIRIGLYAHPFRHLPAHSAEHAVSHAGVMALYDAPEPWGPWTRVKRWTPGDPFGKTRPGSTLEWANNVFFFSFAPKWFSDDGVSFTLVFTGGGNGRNNDSLNTIRGTFELNRSGNDR
jgi:hypothetical protein